MSRIDRVNLIVRVAKSSSCKKKREKNSRSIDRSRLQPKQRFTILGLFLVIADEIFEEARPDLSVLNGNRCAFFRARGERGPHLEHNVHARVHFD